MLRDTIARYVGINTSPQQLHQANFTMLFIDSEHIRYGPLKLRGLCDVAERRNSSTAVRVCVCACVRVCMCACVRVEMSCPLIHFYILFSGRRLKNERD